MFGEIPTVLPRTGLFDDAIIKSDASHSIAVQYLTEGLSGLVSVDVAGVLDRRALPSLRQAPRAALRRRPAVVVLELSLVTTLDFAAVTLPLLATAHTVALCDGQLRAVAGAGVPAFHAIATAGLATRLALHTSIESALAG